MNNPNAKPLQFAINGNGDTADTLLINYSAILDAANDLLIAMANGSPHMRNYQTLPDGADKFAEDVTQWNAARLQVQTIADTAHASLLQAYSKP